MGEAQIRAAELYSIASGIREKLQVIPAATIDRMLSDRKKRMPLKARGEIRVTGPHRVYHYKKW
ncbi:MAG TPA: hypothetical protein DDW96_05780 [Synergistaceae bacterium]|nr:hypothetical protein [Synergistaceae bacterium]